MFIMLLAGMAATPQMTSAVTGHDNRQQVAIDTVTGKAAPSPSTDNRRDTARWRLDAQMEIANRLTGRGLTDPDAVGQNGKTGDLQPAIIRSIRGDRQA